MTADPDLPGEGPPTFVTRASPRMRMSVGAVIVVAVTVLSVTVGVGLLRGASAETVPVDSAADAGPEPITTPTGVHVHVLGEVVRPGLYVLEEGCRLAEALAMAGGTTEAADLRSINLARVLLDGEQVVVATLGAAVVPNAAGGGEGGPEALVDVNTADATALEALPRIGPALAARIVDWREENGLFSSIDDLLAVPGIGEKLLAGIRDRIRV